MSEKLPPHNERLCDSGRLFDCDVHGLLADRRFKPLRRAPPLLRYDAVPVGRYILILAIGIAIGLSLR